MTHTVIRSKMKKTRPLILDPLMSRHVPEMDWYDTSTLRRMLRNYATVYIKPNRGRKGTGIIRLRKLSDSKYEMSYGRESSKCSSKNVISQLKKVMDPKRDYIIQRGIDLATYNGRPFDIRVVLQRPLNRWHLSWMSAKVAPRQNAVVTNVAKGAKDMTLLRVLRGMDQRVNVYDALRKLIDVSYQTAQILGAKFPLDIVGLDMAIDKKGEVWFIEANTKPDFSNLRELDPTQYQRYLAAKRLIR